MGLETPPELVQAVHAFFDRAQDSLPVYVPASRSIVLGLLVVAFVLLRTTPVILQDRREQREEAETWKRHRWVFASLLVLFVCVLLYDKVQETAYRLQVFSNNKQHFVNLHFLKQYSHALRA